MSHAAEPTFPNQQISIRRWIALGLIALSIAVLFFRVPISPGEGNHSYHMLLDLSFRPSAPDTLSADTLDGPLVPLQHPVYVGRSIWRAMTWQTAVNLLLALLVTFAIFGLPKGRAWWALGCFVVLGIADTSVSPWIAILVIGHWAARREQRRLRVLGGVALGVLALTSIAHFLLAAGAIALQASKRAGTPDRGASSATGFVVGVIATWFLLELSLGRLARWLWFGLTGGWTPSALVVPPGTLALSQVAVVAIAVWIGFLLARRKAIRSDPQAWTGFLLIAWAMVLAWKLVALQPAGTHLLFVATILFGGFSLLTRAPKIAGLVFVIGVVAAALPDITLVSNAASRVNLRLLQNITELRQLGGLRDRLRQNFTGYAAGFAMPLTRGALDGGPATVLGDYSMPGILNEFRIVPSVSFGTEFVRNNSAARKNAMALVSPSAPAFVLTKTDEDSDLLPGLRDAPSQLALYGGYDLRFYEQGFLLWRKRPDTSPEAPKLFKAGTVKFGEGISVPDSGDLWWLELDCSPGVTGLVFDQLTPLDEPSVRMKDADGNELRYRLAWRMARAGFIARPFFRGDLDRLRYQQGDALPQVSEVIVDRPESFPWFWRTDIHYRLYQIPSLIRAGTKGLSKTLEQQFAAINRLPSSVFAPFPPTTGIVQDKPSVFMHPDSVLELAVSGTDRALNGAFGIAPGAYASSGPNVTDGVSFSVEFIPATGPRTTLFQRYLDPAAVPDDRGRQTFAVALPTSRGGRLQFRTSNLPRKTSAFDWSYWQAIELK
ncbi:MAG: hypothetical protein ABIO94_02100 [Opitutaceae bacterium]